MNILHIISGDGGGISTYIKNLIKYKSKNFTHTVMSFSNFSKSFCWIANNTNTKLVKMPRPKIDGAFSFFKFLSNFFKNNNYDFIECHIPGVHSAVFKFFSFFNNSTIFSIHSHQSTLVFGRKMKPFERIINFLNPVINNAVSTTKIAASSSAAEYAFGTRKNVVILYNSVDVEKYYNIYNKKHNNKKLILGHIGRHTAAKNLEFLIGLGVYIKKENLEHNFKLKLIGDGELTDVLKQKIREYSLENLIVVEGRRTDIENVLRTFDVLLLPSHSEGFSIVLAEAQASGTPSIVSNTIPNDVDLELGLIKELSIKKTTDVYEDWIQTALNFKDLKSPSLKKVKHKMIEKKFIPEKMVETFEDTVLETIRTKN